MEDRNKDSQEMQSKTDINALKLAAIRDTKNLAVHISQASEAYLSRKSQGDKEHKKSFFSSVLISVGNSVNSLLQPQSNQLQAGQLKQISEAFLNKNPITSDDIMSLKPPQINQKLLDAYTPNDIWQFYNDIFKIIEPLSKDPFRKDVELFGPRNTYYVAIQAIYQSQGTKKTYGEVETEVRLANTNIEERFNMLQFIDQHKPVTSPILKA